MLSSIKNFYKDDTLYKVLLTAAILLGIALRVLFFSYSRPLWNDECALALNITDFANYFAPLKYNQSAPQLFMYLSKLFYMIFPNKTFALRFIPLVSSILSIFVFYKLAAKFIVKHVSVLLAVFLFSVCYRLCYYAQEFKQYSSDVLIFLLILLSYFYLEKIVSKSKRTIIYTVVSVLLLWGSFVSNFGFAALVLCLLIFNKKLFKCLLVPFSIILVNIIIFGLVNLHLHSNTYMLDYWSDGFVNKGFYNFLLLNIKNMKYVFNTGLPLFFIAGSIILMLIKNFKSDKTWLILTPPALNIILSYFEIYPYSTRVILFLIPVFILLLAKLTDFINLKNTVLNNICIGLFCIVMIVPVSIESLVNIVKRNYFEEDIINPLSFAVNNAKMDDVIYISDGNSILYDYYKNDFDIKSPVFVEHERYNDNDAYVKMLDKLDKGKTYYWIMAHHPDKFKRLNYVYNWAKDKKDFKFYADKKGNALIIFTL